MGGDRLSEGWIFDVGKPELQGGLPNHGADRQIARMGEMREQMVLDLKIQTASEPIDDKIARGEIRRRPHLMSRPIVGARGASERGKRDGVIDMGQLRKKG